MTSIKKLKKLINNPNRFFFDYFSKKIGKLENKKINISGDLDLQEEWLIRPGYDFDKKNHPWVQIAKLLKIKSGAMNGNPDQSLLVDSANIFEFIYHIFWISNNLNVAVRIYTIDRKINLKIDTNKLSQRITAELTYSKIRGLDNFVVELIGELENNFAAHIFVYDKKESNLIIVRSNLAFIKKCNSDEFEKIYPEIINKFGKYEFGTPWPVDIVYTWVNKDDSLWVDMWESCFPNEKFNSDRYTNRDELRYSLRSLSKFLPWFHKVHIVSNCARPDWLKDHPKLNWVTHEKIFPDNSVLPTFNSHAIEACLHLIPQLSERFIYFNDDIILNSPCYYSDFFDEIGRTKSNLESYGMVYEENTLDQTPDYLIAAINSLNLIKKLIPNYIATRLHKHSPHALRKSIIEEIEDKYQQEIMRTRSARNRSPEDINLPSFLYHHYAIASGRAIIFDHKSLIVRPSNIGSLFKSLGGTYKFLCFNDGDGSSENKKYTAEFDAFIKLRFPCFSDFEIDHLLLKPDQSLSMSVTIMAYTKREYRIPYLRSKLGDVEICLDDGTLGLYGNSRRSWMMHENTAQFHLVIQDDALVCKDFYCRFDNIVSKTSVVPKELAYCLYFSKKNSEKKLLAEFNIKALNNLSKGYFTDKYLRFGIALVVPVKHIKQMIAHADTREDLKNHDDSRYSSFFAKNNIDILYSLPSLIDQDQLCISTHTGRPNINNCATWFIDGNNRF